MPDSTANEVGRLLRTRRESLRCTQQSLGDELGVRGSYVAMIENGRRKPSLKLIVRLADRLGLDAQQLLVRVRPEMTPLFTATNRASISKARTPTALYHQFTSQRVLLERYHVTKR